MALQILDGVTMDSLCLCRDVSEPEKTHQGFSCVLMPAVDNEFTTFTALFVFTVAVQ